MNPYEQLLDEELVLLQRYGQEEAGACLSRRYLKKRKGFGRFASPNMVSILDEDSYMMIYSHAFLGALSSFQFGFKSFAAYFKTSLNHDLAREVNNQINNYCSPLKIISMDETHSCHEGLTCLHDIVGEEEEYDEAANFLKYVKSLYRLHRLPRGIDKTTISLFEEVHKGSTLKRSCQVLGISYSNGKMKFRRLQNFIHDTYIHQDIPY